MAYRKLGRNSSARKALFRSILTSFFKQERIETTATKAKEISGLAAKLITLAKQGDLHSRRQVLAFLVDEEATKKLFDEIAPKYTTLEFTSSDPVVAMQQKWLFWNWFNKQRLKLQRRLSLQFFYKSY